MKAKLIALSLVTGAALFLVGCADTSTSTTTQTTAQTNPAKQTYSQNDLQRSGRASTGPALKTIDPDVQ